MFLSEKNTQSLTTYLFLQNKYTYSAEWLGNLVENLGIDNTNGIQYVDYDSLEKNIHPVLKTPIIQKKSTGEQRTGSNILMFPPQSMSVLLVANLTWNQEIANTLMDIFLEEVRRVLRFIESEHAQARIRLKKGREIIKTKSLVFANFVHIFQSQLSPFVHVHTRLFQPTMVNDKFYTLRNDLIELSSMLYGLLFRAGLMHQLQKIGLETIVTDAHYGFFEIKGIENIAECFQSRSDEIENYKSEYVQQYPELPANFIKKISIRKNRQINNDETDVKSILKTITSQLEAYGFSKAYFEHFWNIRRIKKRQILQADKLLYLAYLEYGDKLFKYSQEAIMKILALQSIKINQGVLVEDLIVLFNHDNCIDNLRTIVNTQLQNEKRMQNATSTINFDRPRVVVNYAQGAHERARRVRESARIAHRNADENNKLINDTIRWAIIERLYDLQLKQAGFVRAASWIDTGSKAVESFTFDKSDGQDIDNQINYIKL